MTSNAATNAPDISTSISVPPIHTLPSELLGRIFWELIGIGREDYSSPKDPIVQYPELLLRVCNYWAVTASGHARLWSFIRVDSSLGLGPYQTLDGYARNRVAKSGDCPLEISIYYRDTDIDRALDAITGKDGSIALRWRTMGIAGLTTADIPFFAHETPELKDLYLGLFDLVHRHIGKHFFPCTPKLTTLSCKEAGLLLRDHQMNNAIVSLTLLDTETSLIWQLAFFPNIRRLTVAVIGIGASGSQNRVHLPKLEELVFPDAPDFPLVRWLHAPALRRIELGCMELGWVETLYVPEDMPSVATLIIWNLQLFGDRNEFRNLLLAFPNLTSLIMENVKWGLEDVTELLSCLDDVTICPALKVCAFDNDTLGNAWIEARTRS